jgi:hypothetical protein
MSEKKSFDFLKIGSLGRRKPKRDPKYATFNRRMLAATFDSLLFMFLAPLFDRLSPVDRSTLPQYISDPNDPQAMRQWMLDVLSDQHFLASLSANWAMQVVGLCIFSAACWHFWSATPGKMLMRIRIVDATTEQPMSDMQIVLRVCSYFVSGTCLFLGFFWIGIDKKRRAWHDLLAHTVVVTVPWKKIKTESEA